MKFFQNQFGEVFAFDDDAAPIFYEGLIPITEQEAMGVVDKPPTVAQLLEGAKNHLRTMRAPMLDALSGIAGRAVRSGNDELAAEADALAELLLDITDDPALNAATTYEEMQAAGMVAYRRIASGANPELVSVFKEITGA